MDIAPRMKQILEVLLPAESPVSVKYIAEQIGVSRRTVHRELEYIDSVLKPYHVRFVSKTGVGVRLEGESEDMQRLKNEISGIDDYDVSNKEERRKRLVLEILKDKGLKKLFYYSSQFKVSEATISKDLEAAETWLEKYGLKVTRKPGSGTGVTGSEEDYRRAIKAFINENIDTRVLREAYEDDEAGEDRYEALKKSSIGQLLNDDIIKRVIDCISGIDHARVLSLTENSYVGLIIHITIALNRIMKNEVVDEDNAWFEEDENDEDYQLASAIVRELEEEFEIRIPKVEISYICLHIKGSKHESIRWNGREAANMENRELHELVNAMIDAFDYEKGHLLRQDEEFIQGLLAHLQPTLIRLVYGMQIQNPILEDIKSDYPDIYRKCLRVAEVLEKKTGKKVPEEETGFLTVHFGAAMVRLEGRNEEIRPVNVSVVCSSGIGVSRLMSSKLKKNFRERMILTAYGKNDITPYIIGKTDFLISSLALDVADIPVVYVNPLLNEDDMEQIRQMVYRFERMPQKKHREADRFSDSLEEINLVAAQVRTVIKYMEFFKVDNGISFDELLIAVSEKLSPYSDRREMIREDIMRRERINSQIFAEFGFALLHTRTKGVIRPSFTVCMTKDLSPFWDPYFKGIRTVLVMLVPEDDMLRINNEIMGYISSTLIEEYEFLETIEKGDKEEIRDILSRYLKKYFAKYLSEHS